MKIDAHQHFWKYNAVEYPWLNGALSTLRRDFLPADLQTEMAAAGMDGVVSVQARQSLAETEWLLDLAARHDFIKGVVGWVELVSPRVKVDLEKWTANPKLKAVRHVVQDEPDERFLWREDFNRGIAALQSFSLAYDILIFERHLPAAIQLVDRHPHQRFVLDHLAKPKIKSGELSPWRENLRELARRPNVWCKLSGLVTEADFKNWTETQLRPYFEIALEAFGPRRLMFGSDWPVCRVACDYRRWHDVVRAWTAGLSRDEQAWIWGRTAAEFYRLP
ncbi:MAG TPA: amidohydrolase family protein [Verrucomicrobiae bacterium]|nr:amidohydrolase family protein [Verrucomicrobiae bacterium]